MLPEGCAMCGQYGTNNFVVEDLPVGPRTFCTEKHFAQYAGLPVKESGYYGFEAEYDQSIDISMTCPKCEKTLLPVGEGGDRKSENMMHFDYYCDCDENKESQVWVSGETKCANCGLKNHPPFDLSESGSWINKFGNSSALTNLGQAFMKCRGGCGRFFCNSTQALKNKPHSANRCLTNDGGEREMECVDCYNKASYNAESFESEGELERKYFARFGDKRGGKEWGEYNFTWFNDVGDWKPIDKDTTGWDEDDYDSFRDNKEYDLVNQMLDNPKSSLYGKIENNTTYTQEEEFDTTYKVLNEDGDVVTLNLLMSWDEPEIEQQKIQYYDKEPLLNLEFLAESFEAEDVCPTCKKERHGKFPYYFTECPDKNIKNHNMSNIVVTDKITFKKWRVVGSDSDGTPIWSKASSKGKVAKNARKFTLRDYGAGWYDRLLKGERQKRHEPQPKRTEHELMEEIYHNHTMWEYGPENLWEDGEASLSRVKEKLATSRRKIKIAEKELGRKVSQSQAIEWARKNTDYENYNAESFEAELDGIELPVCCGDGMELFPYNGDIIITCQGYTQYFGIASKKDYCGKSKRLSQLQDGILWEDCGYCGGDLWDDDDHTFKTTDGLVCLKCYDEHYKEDEEFEAETFEATEWIGFCPECNKWRNKEMSKIFKNNRKDNNDEEYITDLAYNGWTVPKKLLGKQLCMRGQRFGNVRSQTDSFTGYGQRTHNDSYCGTPLTKVKSKYKSETKKMNPVEKAGLTGVASGATMEGLETLLAAESEELDETQCDYCGKNKAKSEFPPVKGYWGRIHPDDPDENDKMGYCSQECFVGSLGKCDDCSSPFKIGDNYNRQEDEYETTLTCDDCFKGYPICESCGDKYHPESEHMESCGKCGGNGWIMTDYDSGDRWEPASSDSRPCEECYDGKVCSLEAESYSAEGDDDLDIHSGSYHGIKNRSYDGVKYIRQGNLLKCKCGYEQNFAYPFGCYSCGPEAHSGKGHIVGFTPNGRIVWKDECTGRFMVDTYEETDVGWFNSGHQCKEAESYSAEQKSISPYLWGLGIVGFLGYKFLNKK